MEAVPIGSTQSYVWLRGDIVPLSEARVSIDSETALRGANVFEGIRGYWQGGAQGLLFAGLRQHMARLLLSARLLCIAHRYGEPHHWRLAIEAVLDANGLQAGADVYVRPSICIETGRLPTDLNYSTIDYVSASALPRHDLLVGRSAIVSRWRRPADSTLPPQVKSGGAYLAFRLPFVELAETGADGVILLNHVGEVAEAEGAAVCTIRQGVIRSPRASTGALRSITLDLVETIAARLDLPFKREPITHAELYESDALFLVGTMCELLPIISLHSIELATLENTEFLAIASAFDDLRSGRTDGRSWMQTLGDLS